jgi:iron complex transport system substrate-binding protein
VPDGGAAADGSYSRIVPTNAAAVDLVFDLVGAGRVAAVPSTVDEFANVAVDPVGFGPERRFGEFNAEVLLAFAPDLAVVSPWQGQDTIERMREAGVRVVELSPVEELADLRAGILELGGVLGAEARATELVEAFDARVVALELKGAARAGETAISYTNYGSGGWVAGSGTTADLVMGLCGLTNRAVEAGRIGHDTVDIEALLTWDPDWIVVSKPSTTLGVTRAYLEGEAALASLRAIRTRHIVEVQAALYSTTSHYLVGAAEALDAALDRAAGAEAAERE